MVKFPQPRIARLRRIGASLHSSPSRGAKRYVPTRSLRSGHLTGSTTVWPPVPDFRLVLAGAASRSSSAAGRVWGWSAFATAAEAHDLEDANVAIDLRPTVNTRPGTSSSWSARRSMSTVEHEIDPANRSASCLCPPPAIRGLARSNRSGRWDVNQRPLAPQGGQYTVCDQPSKL